MNPCLCSGMVLVVCAPSGTGKTTLIRRLTSEYPRFAFSVSCTTRAPRLGEVPGHDYQFVSRDDFISLRDAGWFAEWAEVHGNFYGTPLHSAKSLLEQGRDVLFDIDVQGAAQLKKSMPGAKFIFIMPPSRDELLKRLQKRGTENEESLAKRMAQAGRELDEAHWFDFCIVNDNLEIAWQDLKAVYHALIVTPSYQCDFLDGLRKEWSYDPT